MTAHSVVSPVFLNDPDAEAVTPSAFALVAYALLKSSVADPLTAKRSQWPDNSSLSTCFDVYRVSTSRCLAFA